MTGEFPGVSLKQNYKEPQSTHKTFNKGCIISDIPLPIQLRFSATKPMKSDYFPMLLKHIYSEIFINNVYSLTCGNTSVKHCIQYCVTPYKTRVGTKNCNHYYGTSQGPN